MLCERIYLSTFESYKYCPYSFLFQPFLQVRLVLWLLVSYLALGKVDALQLVRRGTNQKALARFKHITSMSLATAFASGCFPRSL